LTWDGYVGLAFDDLTLAAAGSPSVTRRIELALDDLASFVPRSRRSAVLARLDAVRADATPTRDRARR